QLGDPGPVQSLSQRRNPLPATPLHGRERLPAGGLGGRRRPRTQSIPDHVSRRRIPNSRRESGGRVFEADPVRGRDRTIPGETYLGQRQHVERIFPQVPRLLEKESNCQRPISSRTRNSWRNRGLGGIRVALNTQYPILVVSSSSICQSDHPELRSTQCTLPVGALIVIRGVDPVTIVNGTIIVFMNNPADPGYLIVHRVVGIVPASSSAYNQVSFRTKG